MLAWLLCTLGFGLAPSQEEDLRAAAERMEGEVAYELHFFGSKVGWAVERTRIGRLEGRPVLCVEARSRMLTGSEDGDSNLVEHNRQWYALDGRGELLKMEIFEVEDGRERVLRLMRGETGWTASVEAAGTERRWKVPVVRRCLAERAELLRWLDGPREAGDSIVQHSIDLDRADLNRAEVHRYVAAVEQRVGGKPTRLHRVDAEVDGIVAELLLCSAGMIRGGTFGGIGAFVPGPEELVRRLEAAPLDLFRATTVVLDRSLDPVDTLQRVVLELRGNEGLVIPVSSRQRVENTGPGTWRVSLLRGRDWGQPAPLDDAERARWLAADHRTMSDDPRIVDAARNIAGDREVLEASQRLQLWIYDNLRGASNENTENAVEVLTRRAGDCTEHALLFVAFARALGFPARERTGLLYFDEGEGPRMGWHAWAEVHDGRQWVGVDPAWGELRLAPTRLRMAEDESDLRWVQAMQGLEIRVLEVERR